jgi:hypothetical protein
MNRKRSGEMKTHHEIFITSTTNTFNDIKMVPIGACAVSKHGQSLQCG